MRSAKDGLASPITLPFFLILVIQVFLILIKSRCPQKGPPVGNDAGIAGESFKRDVLGADSQHLVANSADVDRHDDDGLGQLVTFHAGNEPMPPRVFVVQLPFHMSAVTD